MATLSEIKCGLCTSIQMVHNLRTHGIDCKESEYLDKAHRYYKYQFLKENVACGSDLEIDCLIREKG